MYPKHIFYANKLKAKMQNGKINLLLKMQLEKKNKRKGCG